MKHLTSKHQLQLQDAYAYHQAGNLEEAVARFAELHELYPENARLLTALGTVAMQLGMTGEAVRFFEKSIEIEPDQPTVLSNWGVGLARFGSFEKAVLCYDKAVKLQPDYAAAYNNRGIALREMRRDDEALASYDLAIKHKPDYAEAHYNRGNLLIGRGNKEMALASYDRAITLNPSYVQAYVNRGNVLKELKRFDEALVSYDRAIALAPDYAEAYDNRGTVLKELGQIEASLASYDRAIALDPAYAAAYNNRGIALQAVGRFDEALRSYQRALEVDSSYAPAQWSIALLKLLEGDYTEGWKMYEWRWQDTQKSALRVFPQPLWLGEVSLLAKTLLIHGEQGLGDDIQFCRYALLAVAQGAEVILEVPSALVTLMKTLGPHICVVKNGDATPATDYQCPAMSLPLAFKTTMANIPAKVPYLFADSAKIQQWQKRLGEKTLPRVGLVWSGRPEHKNDHNRSIPLKLLEGILQLPMEFHALQKEVRNEDASLLQQFDCLHWHGEELQDFTDTAALIDVMDVVISVDTSVAHLAGALNKPVWVLLPFLPDFRWMLERTDSPWYPSARLFRQRAPGGWKDVIEGVEAALRGRTQ